MKIRVTLHDPDALHEAIVDAVRDEVAKRMPRGSTVEHEAVRRALEDRVVMLAGKWFEHDEYLTVEVDTEASTCTVVPLAERKRT
jgi:hypothetical protein